MLSMWKSVFPYLQLMYFAFFVGGMFILLGGGLLCKFVFLRLTCKEKTEGEVVDYHYGAGHHTTKAKGVHPAYFPIVEFTDKDGKVVRDTLDFGKPKKQFEVGTKVPVRYAAKDSERFFVPKYGDQYFYGALLFVAGILTQMLVKCSFMMVWCANGGWTC